MKAKRHESENPRLVELARKINLGHKKLLSAMRTSLESSRDIGTTLCEAKKVCRELGERQFLKWVRGNCDFSVSQAQRYMRIADHWNELIERTKGKELERLTLVEALKLLSCSGGNGDAAREKESHPTKLTIASSADLDQQATRAAEIVFDDGSPARTFAEKQAEQIARQIVRLVNKTDAFQGRDGENLNKNLAALAILRQLRIALKADLLFDVSDAAETALVPSHHDDREVLSRCRSDVDFRHSNGKSKLASA